MSWGDLPLEVLHNIIRFCDGYTVLPCRLVSKHWRDAVDSLADYHWEQICSNEYRREEYDAVRRKYRLTWRETYRAVNSWSYWKIKRSKVTAQELCSKVNRFKVLPKGIIVCLQNQKDDRYIAYSDSVVYYDSETYQEIDRQHFNFDFLTEQYEESDDFWMFVLRDGRLCIMPKKNKKPFFVGRLLNPNIDDENWWKILTILFCKESLDFSVIDNEVYFKDCDNNIVYVSKVAQNENDGETIVSTTPLSTQSFEECIIQFSLMYNKLHVLTNKGNVYLYRDKQFEFVKGVCVESEKAFIELRECGFDWRSPKVFFWVSSQDHFNSGFCSHSCVTITAFGYKVNIYFSAYIPDNIEELYINIEDKPTKTIEMDEGFQDLDSNCILTNIPIKQIDIIETGTQHKVVICGYGRVYILLLDESRRSDMKLRNNQKPVIIKKVTHKPKKRKKSITQVHQKCTYLTRSTKKHKYNTRSAKKSNSKKIKR